MRAAAAMAVLLSLGGCNVDTAPAANIPPVCESQVYADPVVKDLILKGAGSEYYMINHAEQLKYAKVDAARRCMQQKGLAPPGGGVARPTIRN